MIREIVAFHDGSFSFRDTQGRETKGKIMLHESQGTFMKPVAELECEVTPQYVVLE